MNRSHRPPANAENEPRWPPPSRNQEPIEGHWILSIHHGEGSLEEAVEQARRRNLAIGLATLALLAVTVFLMVSSSRRSQELARQQLDFVASVSHELRTPLTAIRSAGQNLADGIVSEPAKVQRYGLLVEREGRRLTEMIGRVLSFAGIRSGQLSLRADPVDLGAIVRSALADARWVLEEKGIELQTQVADDLPEVRGDATALRQVVSNLVDNAVKYGGSGGWLGVHLHHEGETLVLRISDRGPGIPRKEQREIFEAFRRARSSGSSSIPGSGLGLAVVRRLVEAHGGTVSLVSRAGEGARFEVRLPVMMGGGGS
jgi:signal transduction histidine kinase